MRVLVHHGAHVLHGLQSIRADGRCGHSCTTEHTCCTAICPGARRAEPDQVKSRAVRPARTTMPPAPRRTPAVTNFRRPIPAWGWPITTFSRTAERWREVRIMRSLLLLGLATLKTYPGREGAEGAGKLAANFPKGASSCKLSRAGTRWFPTRPTRARTGVSDKRRKGQGRHECCYHSAFVSSA